MDVTTILFAAALVAIGWMFFRWRRPAGTPDAVSPVDAMDGIAPKPIAPRLALDGWDGYSGLQRALCVKLAEGMFFPIVEAGAMPPVAQTRTFSTSRADQSSLEIVLYACEPEKPERAELVLRAVLAPIPITGSAIREVELTFAVDAAGRVAIDGRAADAVVPVEIAVEGVGAIPVGPCFNDL